jgi:hypothetical protein
MNAFQNLRVDDPRTSVSTQLPSCPTPLVETAPTIHSQQNVPMSRSNGPVPLVAISHPADQSEPLDQASLQHMLAASISRSFSNRQEDVFSNNFEDCLPMMWYGHNAVAPAPQHRDVHSGRSGSLPVIMVHNPQPSPQRNSSQRASTSNEAHENSFSPVSEQAPVMEKAVHAEIPSRTDSVLELRTGTSPINNGFVITRESAVKANQQPEASTTKLDVFQLGDIRVFNELPIKPHSNQKTFIPIFTPTLAPGTTNGHINRHPVPVLAPKMLSPSDLASAARMMADLNDSQYLEMAMQDNPKRHQKLLPHDSALTKIPIQSFTWVHHWNICTLPRAAECASHWRKDAYEKHLMSCQVCRRNDEKRSAVANTNGTHHGTCNKCGRANGMEEVLRAP